MPAAYLRSLNPELPRPVWILQAGGLANFFGNGVVLPFLIIYLHNVRGISLTVAGLVAATNSLVAIPTGILAGTLTDRLGAKRVLAAALLVMAVAIALFPLITEAWHAFLLNGLLGLGSGAFWPSQGALLTALTPAHRRHAAFGLQRVTMSLGFGLGGLTGGLIASASSAESFTVLFLLDAATFVMFAAILSRLPAAAPQAHEEAGSYRDVLRNRPFMAFAWLNVVFVAAGVVLLNELLPVFVKNEAGVDEGLIGAFFLVHTATIVVAQLPITKWSEGRRRMALLAAMAVIWAASWLAVLAMGAWLRGDAAFGVMIGVGLLFAIGACLHGTVGGPIVVDLAEPRAIGRYIAVSTLSWQVAFTVGPAIGGAVLDAQPLALWPAAAAVLLASAVASLLLERAIPHNALRNPKVPPLELPGAEAAPAPGLATRPSG
jgi:predicted MFS family arabinose efflux permease